MTTNRVAYAATFESLAGKVRVCRGCDRPAPFRGFDNAHAEGWSWELDAGRIAWRCGECPKAGAA